MSCVAVLCCAVLCCAVLCDGSLRGWSVTWHCGWMCGASLTGRPCNDDEVSAHLSCSCDCPACALTLVTRRTWQVPRCCLRVPVPDRDRAPSSGLAEPSGRAHGCFWRRCGDHPTVVLACDRATGPRPGRRRGSGATDHAGQRRKRSHEALAPRRPQDHCREPSAATQPCHLAAGEAGVPGTQAALRVAARHRTPAGGRLLTCVGAARVCARVWCCGECGCVGNVSW